MRSLTTTEKQPDYLEAPELVSGCEVECAFSVTFSQTLPAWSVVENTGSMDDSTVDAWGRVLGVYDGNGSAISESAIGNRYLWQGREYSWNTGFYYFRARWYDPITGRWLSKDPIGISGGLNQYVFCGNNPVNFVDPWGLRIWQSQYWVERSIRGGWLNKSFSCVMGVLACAVPDVATVEVRATGAVVGGSSAGKGFLINPGAETDCEKVKGYTTSGVVVGSPQVAISINFSIAWSSELAPSSADYGGFFDEGYVNMEFLEVGAYSGGQWKGLSAGLNGDLVPLPAAGSYQRVHYDIK